MGTLVQEKGRENRGLLDDDGRQRLCFFRRARGHAGTAGKHKVDGWMAGRLDESVKKPHDQFKTQTSDLEVGDRDVVLPEVSVTQPVEDGARRCDRSIRARRDVGNINIKKRGSRGFERGGCSPNE